MNIKRVLPIIGLAIFVYLIFKIGPKNIINSITNVNVFLLIISVLIIIPTILMQTLKWFVLLKKQQIKISFKETLRLQVMSMFYGIITPARIGSFIKIAYIKDKAKTFGKSMSSVVIDRALDTIVISIMALIGVIVILGEKSSFMNIAIFLGILLVLFIALLEKRISRPFLKFIYKRLLPEKLKKGAKKGFNDFYKSMPRKRFLIWPFLLNVISWVLVYTQTYFIALALGIKISYLYFIILLPISTVIALIPITVSGLGTREASLVALFSLFGIPAAKVFAMSILSIVLADLIPSIIGFFLSLKMEIKPKDKTEIKNKDKSK